MFIAGVELSLLLIVVNDIMVISEKIPGEVTVSMTKASGKIYEDFQILGRFYRALKNFPPPTLSDMTRPYPKSSTDRLEEACLVALQDGEKFLS
jgi:hypothetical protein